MIYKLRLQLVPHRVGHAATLALTGLSIQAGGDAHRAFESLDDLQQGDIFRREVETQPAMRPGGVPGPVSPTSQLSQIETWKITLRNHKSTPIEMEVEEFLQARVNWEIDASSDEYTKKDYRTIVFKKQMPANSEWIINYTVRYWW